MTAKQEVIEKYGHYLDAFIKEINPYTSKEEILSQMDVYPIVVDDRTIGVVGLNTQKTRVGGCVIIRLVYVEPAYRGKKLLPLGQHLINQFRSQGFTHMECWALPRISDWLEKTLGLKPKLRVYHESLEKLAAIQAGDSSLPKVQAKLP
jgi:hypothetical protein